MKALFCTLGLFAGLTLMPLAHADDLSGTWKGSFDFNGSSVPTTLNLKVDGEAVSGTIEGLPNSPTDIHDGKIDGNTVTFWINTDYQGQNYRLVYNGKVAASEIDFSFGTEDGSWGSDLVVKRDGVAAPKPEDLTGAWKGSFDFQGSSMPILMNLQSHGDAVTGTVEGMGPSPVEIHDGKIDGNAVTFWLNTDYQGQTYALTYKGTISPDQINFDFGTADGSWSAMLTVKKP